MRVVTGFLRMDRIYAIDWQGIGTRAAQYVDVKTDPPLSSVAGKISNDGQSSSSAILWAGGLVVQQALLYSDGSPDIIQRVVDSTLGVLILTTNYGYDTGYSCVATQIVIFIPGRIGP